ncbi:MAG: hypothetical protein A2428_06285 [Bdellovibrionales bacterium RIFOXYC1_FULL_54_43]|nr:MAG: hypothetical protein A2428_06285 [Bdellovibrionales bacterium RIFOXYC1_FULL_54_43]OFZ81458.1 MAG: hypothetical protein A2603_07115 [Bdellovibrionales bacterium RIFOXYD1_FULL_55_31]
MDERSEINRLMEMAIRDDAEGLDARRKAQALLGLDDANWFYYLTLFERNTVQNRQGVVPEARTAYPLSTAPADLLKHLRMVAYTDLAKHSEFYNASAKKAALWIKKMQAGTGSSVSRTSYLARRFGVTAERVTMGAKGTDLFIDVLHPITGRPVKIPIVEAQILQSILDRKAGVFGKIIFHDLVSSETQKAIREIWQKRSLLDPKRTYEELVQETPGLERFRATVQSYLPTLDEDGQITFERLAPGGHALFAVDALRATRKPELRPEAAGNVLVSAISNGEDIGGTPDALMVGWMIAERIPIVLVTTDKTAVDMKGGVISLLKSSKGDVSLTVLETAQAEAAGQGDIFKKAEGCASTNLTLFNYEVLVPKIEQLVCEIGEDQFLKIIAPDLIRNVKKQKDAAGKERKYLQLEGAMGSTLMNLDRYWRRRYGEPLVHLINVDRRHRTQFFSPIKSAFDFYMQFHSDRFRFEVTNMRLKNLRPGELPVISLKDGASDDRYYQDVETVLEVFRGASILNLDALTIEGRVKLTGVVLRGRIEIINQSAAVVELGRSPLENARITVGTDGSIQETQL